MLVAIGFFGALLMGVSLGLIGGGGSIFSVPILVYLFSINPVIATGYSLFVVGITSLTGSINHIRMGNIQWKAVFFFGIPSIASVFITRTLLVPLIPEEVFSIGSLHVSKPMFFLLLFALFMMAAAMGMMGKFKRRRPMPRDTERRYVLMLTMAGLVEGCLTGLVGAGGGFLIIPALVLLGKVPMKKAVGSSLIIIAVKSLMGFMGDMHNDLEVNWKLLITFGLFAIGGIMLGSSLSKFISNEKLKPIFGYFILAMALLILIKELILKIQWY